MELYSTKTGENTLYLATMDETYHSRNGAISEALHVFIKECFSRIPNQNVFTIFEVGFGTGLNALVTAVEASKLNQKVDYYSVEAFPVPSQIALKLNYGTFLKNEKLFEEITLAPWEGKVAITPFFNQTKYKGTIQDLVLPDTTFDAIYFDAFAPKKQPELWKKELFEKLHSSLKTNGVLTTYSAAGQLKRDLKSIGFKLEHPPGANGKREMTVAVKV